MSRGVINFASGGQTAASTQFSTGTFNSTTGNCLVIGLVADATNLSTLLSIKNAAGQSATEIAATVNTPFSTLTGAMFYIPNCTGQAGDAITVNFSGAGLTFAGACVWEIAGYDISAPSDTGAIGSSGAGNPSITAAFTTQLANEILLSICSAYTGTGVTYVAGGTSGTWATDLDNSSDASGFLEGAGHILVSTIQTNATAQFELDSSRTNLICVSTFKAQSGQTTFSPAAGSYSGAQTITLTAPDGGTVYYTTDGTAPTTGSSSVSSGGTVAISATATLKTLVTTTGFTNSAIASAAYTITVGGGAGVTGLLRLLGVD